MYAEELYMLFGDDKLCFWQVATAIFVTLWAISYFFDPDNAKPTRRIFVIPLAIICALGWLITYLYNLPLGEPMQLVIPTETSMVFIPLVMAAPASARVGVETEWSMVSNGQYYNPSTPLKVSVRGHEVITVSGYDWTTIDKKLAGYHADWITVKQRPSWMGDGEICELPAREYWDDYADFIQAVIDRYHPDYVEIWNEPNASLDAVPESNYPLFGCVGDGSEYGEFAAYMHDSVSGAYVILGAVSKLDEDFILDMLRAAGGSYDGVSFHCYAYFYNAVAPDCRESYKAAQRLTLKPVYISEGAVIYRTGTEFAFEIGQVEHFRRLSELPTPSFWYTLCNNGWPQPISTDMCDRPVWYEYIQ